MRPARFVLLSRRRSPLRALRLHCLNVCVIWGCPGVLQLGCCREIPQKPSLVSPHTCIVWTISTPQVLSLQYPQTCQTELYGLALARQLCACTHATPAQASSAPSGHVVFWFTAKRPHHLPSPAPSTWPWAAICKHFGLFTVFLHTWAAFLASLNPEEDQSCHFQERRMIPFSILQRRALKSVSEVKARVGHLRQVISARPQRHWLSRGGISRRLQQDRKGGDQ